MERREFLKLTLGFTAAAGSIAAMAAGAAQAAPMLPPIGGAVPDTAAMPVETSMHGKAEPAMQGDANAMALQAFAHVASPPLVVNIAGPEQVSIRRIAEQFGERMGKMPLFEGEEAPNALISNGQRGHFLFGYPKVGVEQMIHWIADWVMHGGESLGKPTHFEVRDGKF